jgi:hypothetical protein
MAFSFGASEANRLVRTTSILSPTAPAPITICFRLKQATTTARIFGISQWIFENNWSVNGDPRLGVGIHGGTTNMLSWYTNSAYASSATYTPDTNWHTYGLTAASGAPGAITFYRDGVSITGATTTMSIAGNGLETGCSIGALAFSYGASFETGFNIDGSLADFAVWSAVLDAAEMAAYGKGFAPKLIRPNSLVAWLPMIADSNRDRMLGDWTAVGTLTKQADHPRVITTAGPLLIATLPIAAGAAATSLPFPPMNPAMLSLLMR